MSESAIPDVRLAAVVITRGSSFLTLFNDRWGAFTLPMTKRRVLPDGQKPDTMREEDALHAAIRAAAEALGRPMRPSDLPRHLNVPELQPFQQGDRDGLWKSYRFEVFHLAVGPDEAPSPAGSVPIAWLTLEEMRTAQPVSPTAIRIVEAVEAAAVLRGDR